MVRESDDMLLGCLAALTKHIQLSYVKIKLLADVDKICIKAINDK